MRFLIFFLFISTVAFADVPAALPAPYNNVADPLPFLDHGWFSNQKSLVRLIKKHNVKTVIEVGSWLGKSTIFLAENLPEEGVVYAVDHWLGSEEHVGDPLLSKLYEQFLSNIIHSCMTHKVIPVKQDSLVAAKDLAIFADLIYIDAAHDTESVYKDLKAWHNHLAKDGVLCGDDWKWDTVRAAVKKFAEENDLRVKNRKNFWWYE